mgnify:CR=1 FL=1
MSMSGSSDIQPGERITLTVDGVEIAAHLGQTLAAALLANGQRILRHTRRAGKPRGLYCAMGVCYDCVMTVNGNPGVRACMTKVEAGMQVVSPVQFQPYARPA